MKLFDPLQKKYSLPKWEELDDVFDIGVIDEKDFSLKLVRSHVREKFQYVIHLLEPILHPDAVSYAELCECNVLSDVEKASLLEVYKRLIMIDRDFLIASLSSSEENDAMLIKKAFSAYKEIVPKLIPYFTKIRDSWNGATEKEEWAGYLG